MDKKLIINTNHKKCYPNPHFQASRVSAVIGDYQQSDVKVRSMSYFFFHVADFIKCQM